MGLLMVAVYGGNTVGPLIGGVIADNLGYEWAFYITGATLMLGAIVVMLFVRERFTRPAQGTAASLAGMFRLVKSRQVMPVLGITLSLNAGPGIISPVISLYIQKMKPGADAAALAGTAIFLMGVATTISALVAGRLGQRVNLKKMIVWCCLGTAVLCCPPMFAGTVTQLIVAMAFMDALKGGLLVTSNTLIGMVAPLDQQGIAYGINQSANSLGGALGPLIGGAVAPLIGLKYVFGVTAGVYFIVAVIAGKLLANVQLPRSAPATNAAAK
jgi:DHA1 family multidrug resistance protein-like MFS transporter